MAEVREEGRAPKRDEEPRGERTEHGGAGRSGGGGNRAVGGANRSVSGGGGSRRFGRGPGSPRRGRTCPFCEQKVREVDYKNADELRRYLTERGKIKPRRKNATCAKHQRRLAVAIKRARHLALLPFTTEAQRG